MTLVCFGCAFLKTHLWMVVEVIYQLVLGLQVNLPDREMSSPLSSPSISLLFQTHTCAQIISRTRAKMYSFFRFLFLPHQHVCFTGNNINISEWSSHFPPFNPTENLSELNSRLQARRPSSLKNLGPHLSTKQIRVYFVCRNNSTHCEGFINMYLCQKGSLYKFSSNHVYSIHNI